MFRTFSYLNKSRNILFKNNVSMFSKSIVYSDYCKPAASYSAATKANGFIFVSGQLGLKDGKFVSDKVEEQTEQALINVIGVVNDSGSNINNIVKTTVLLADINDFSKVNQIYAKAFSGVELPARAAYAVANLPLGAKVEIEAIATQ